MTQSSSSSPGVDLPATAAAQRNELLRVTYADGNLTLRAPAPGILFGVVRGRLSLAMAEQWIAAIAPRLKGANVLTGFHDWEQMKGYDSSARYALTRFLLATHRQQPAHILVASGMVAMGVAAASLTLAVAGVTLTSYSSRAKFDSALQRSIAR